MRSSISCACGNVAAAGRLTCRQRSCARRLSRRQATAHASGRVQIAAHLLQHAGTALGHLELESGNPHPAHVAQTGGAGRLEVGQMAQVAPGRVIVRADGGGDVTSVFLSWLENGLIPLVRMSRYVLLEHRALPRCCGPTLCSLFVTQAAVRGGRHWIWERTRCNRAATRTTRRASSDARVVVGHGCVRCSVILQVDFRRYHSGTARAI